MKAQAAYYKKQRDSLIKYLVDGIGISRQTLNESMNRLKNNLISCSSLPKSTQRLELAGLGYPIKHMQHQYFNSTQASKII